MARKANQDQNEAREIGSEHAEHDVPKPTPTAVQRFSVNLAPDTASAIREYAEKKDISMTDAFRRAILLMSFLDHEIERGAEIQSVRADGSVAQLVVL